MAKTKFKVDFQGYLTLSYLSLVVIGMMFDYQYYSLFNINIFEYSDILDFILAPVKNLELILFALASILFVLLVIRVDKYWSKKAPKLYNRLNFGLGKPGAETKRSIYYAVGLIAYLFISSLIYSERQLQKFNVSARQLEVIFESGEKSVKGRLIGKNSDYIFLIVPDSTIKAIPILTDVQEINLGKFE